MNWILIAFVIIVLFVIFKSKEVKHRVFSIFILLLIVFVALTFSQIISQPGVNFYSFEGIMGAGKLYFIWLKHAFSNVVQLTGNAVKLDWGTNLTGG